MASNTNYNYSNSSATSNNAKGSGTSDPNQESRGELINARDAADRQSAAVAAEREWIKQVSAAPVSDTRKNNKIRLVSTATATGNGKINTGTEQITFNLTPEISESKQVIYAEIGDIRQAGSILIYGGSPSRRWSVNSKFLSRTAEEADSTWKSIQLLKAWGNPDTNYKYGIDSGTPYVLKLYGYGRTWQGIPVVLTSVNVDYASDVDFIPTVYGTNVPIIQTVSFQLTEARTPDDLLVKFDLEKFKRGILPEW
ncbi:hypothetical protein Xoosp13_289 [Xanthomonas phage Xoo-sp13]|nr:hypothetical protein Xoosp13_289 [Xanthomonas phage Xoo-sp13]